MLVLGIESSCDDTAIAILRNGREVLAATQTSQLNAHLPFGGVVPELAAREHLKNIFPIYKKVLDDADINPAEIDLIAVTQGPGLVGSLLVGVSFAKGLATALDKPLIPVNHVHAHVHGALLGLEQAEFPAMALVVSGGHTILFRMQNPTDFQLLATTLDDACGECFDKVAKLLGLPYPGGPAIEACAKKGQASKHPMPRMLAGKRLAFSYSGLKTHILRKVHPNLTDQEKADLCAAFQDEALGQALRKVKLALQDKPDTKNLIIAGGVAANSRLRTLAKDLKIPTLFPKLDYCTDNGAMIASLGYWNYTTQAKSWPNNHSWEVAPRYDFRSKGDLA